MVALPLEAGTKSPDFESMVIKMKKKWIGWLMGTVSVMFLLPWAAVTFVKKDAGMTATLLLFFMINPVYAMAAMFLSSWINGRKQQP